MRTCRTVQGDTWDTVARRELGSDGFAGAVMDMNHGALDYLFFPAGVELRLPEELEDTAGDDADLPPWKRVSG